MWKQCKKKTNNKYFNFRGTYFTPVDNARISGMFETLIMTQQPPGIGMLGGDSFVESINPGNSFTPKYQQKIYIHIRNAQYQQSNQYRRWGIIE